jgi:hypothetical protein
VDDQARRTGNGIRVIFSVDWQAFSNARAKARRDRMVGDAASHIEEPSLGTTFG